MRTRTIRHAALLFLIIALALPSAASALEINRQVLDNGLTVLHVEKKNLPMVEATLIVQAGQKDEPGNSAGIASLTASLLNEGTKSRSSVEISSELEFIGASFSAGGDMDYTSLKLSVLRRHYEKGFEVFFDILRNPVFKEEELERKKGQTIAALKLRLEDPDFVAEQAFSEAVFGTHPYAHARQGTPESLDSITRDDVVSFYRKRYVPEGAVLAFVGDISKKEVQHLVDTYLADWEGTLQKTGQETSPPDPKRQTITIDRDVTQANIYLGHIGVSRNNPDYYALSLMNYILGGGGFTSRLMQSIRDEMGLAYSVYSLVDPNHDTGSFYVNIQTKNSSANTAISEILSQMKRISAEPVSENELADAKSYYIGSFPRRLETMRRISDFLCAVEFYGLGMDYPEKYRDYIEAVTTEDVLRVARKYLHPDKYVLVIVGDMNKVDIDPKLSGK